MILELFSANHAILRSKPDHEYENANKEISNAICRPITILIHDHKISAIIELLNADAV